MSDVVTDILSEEEVLQCCLIWKDLAYIAKRVLDSATDTGQVQRAAQNLAFWAGLSAQQNPGVHESMAWFTIRMSELGAKPVHEKLEAIYRAARIRAVEADEELNIATLMAKIEARPQAAGEALGRVLQDQAGEPHSDLQAQEVSQR